MHELDHLVAGRVEQEFGWMRRTEILARVVAFFLAAAGAILLVIGIWQPSIERVAQYLFALLLCWTAASLLWSVVGAVLLPDPPNPDRLQG